MRIMVTGHAGHLGQALLPALCAKADVSEVLGVDLKRSEYTHPKLSQLRLNISRLSDEQLRGIDVVIHLAFSVTQRGLSIASMHENNVEATLKLFGQCNAAGIGHIVNLSSVSVYGSGLLVGESTPMNADPNFPYAVHKQEVELGSSEWKNITHLRSHFIVGPHSQPFLRWLCQSPFYLWQVGRQPLIQVIHEDDVVRAILLAIEKRVTGALNLSCEGSFSLATLVKHGRKFVLPFPVFILKLLVRSRHLFSRQKDIHWIDTIILQLDTTLTVSVDKARAVLSWAPRFDMQMARASMFQTPSTAEDSQHP